MIDDFAKEYLHSELREIREAMLWKLDGTTIPRTPTSLGRRRGPRHRHVGSEHETRNEVIDRYSRVWEHSDATITTLDIDSPGYVPWWPRPDVKLFTILVHMLTETSRHAGHADILREQLDGVDGDDGGIRRPATRRGPLGSQIRGHRACGSSRGWNELAGEYGAWVNQRKNRRIVRQPARAWPGTSGWDRSGFGRVCRPARRTPAGRSHR
jgi:hypothetical protein